MRLNKITVYFSGAISVISLLIAICCRLASLEFTASVFVSLFASAILALVLGIVGYCTSRRSTLEKFYAYALKAAANYNKFNNEDGLEAAIDSVLQMDDFDYLELDNAYGDMSFFFHDKSTRKYIYDTIYSKTLSIRKLIQEKTYHFKIYRKSVNGNKAVMQKFLDEIDTAIMVRSTSIHRNEDGTEMTVSSCENKLVLDLRKEISGKYYDLMYPFKKEATDHAD